MKPSFRKTQSAATFATLAGIGLSTLSWNAEAAGLDHEYNWRNRSPYQSNVYFTNQVFFDQTTLATAESNEKSTAKSVGSEVGSKSASVDYRGHTLQAGLGVEHFRFVQTGITFSHSQLSQKSDKRSTLQGQEVGAHVKLVLSSPVVNVSLFAGPHLSQKSYVSPDSNGSLQGTGGSGGIEFVYFLSTKVAFVASGGVAKEQLKKSSSSGNLESVSSTASRVGAGFSIWF